MLVIELSDGSLCEIDDEFAWLKDFRWQPKYSSNTCYAFTVLSRKVSPTQKKIRMHRAIMNVLDSPHIEIDHIDGNGLNNQCLNLRFATRSQNAINQGVRTNSETGYKGVSIDHSGTGLYKVRIAHKWIGRFSDVIEAAKAYDKAAKELYGEYARTNF